MLAYKNDPQLKTYCLSRIDAGFPQNIVNDHFGHEDDYSEMKHLAHALHSEFGIPQRIAYLLRPIYANEPKTAYCGFFEAVRPGSDLSHVSDQFVHWLLIDRAGPRKGASKADLLRFDQAAALYESRLQGVDPPRADWEQQLFLGNFTAWYASSEKLPQRFSHFAYSSVLAAHHGARCERVAHAAVECTSDAYRYVMADQLIDLVRKAG